LKNTKHPLYNVWLNMKSRCFNENNPQYHTYGGRGIYVCDEWKKDFQRFVEDMPPRPTRDHQLDRTDNDGPYSPDNCQWSTRKVNMERRTNTTYVEIDGTRYKLLDLVKISGRGRDTVLERVKRGYGYSDVISSDNLWRMPDPSLGGQATAKIKRALTHCKHGHEFTPENTILENNGRHRRCRTCHYARMKKQRAANG